MQEHEKTFLELIIMGALIGVAKLLVSSEQLTFRVIVGRALLGSATSMVAGVVLLQIPELPPLALLGIGSALGIVGSQYIEILLRRKTRAILGGE
ncbi:holin [Burkholderia stagnalis]|uniref:phage holin family protein n=1 Tax=Burkholderia stagnalis TaxID=1503054 RepID=UPI00075367B0|nr:phage holin family protein [Burkholderia stagnalis]KVL84190.1 holin [Burkholderia stagnalis]KVL98414.1 holin [Burkholderia stagnalis]KVM16705.1 holin [Burkholderia stagnalis]KVX62478.1 holin [Burkholderia stagnalis]RQQ19738.1 holin [Burkholderia stagnalis]